MKCLGIFVNWVP